MRILLAFWIFMLLILGLTWALLWWGTREVDRMTKDDEEE